MSRKRSKMRISSPLKKAEEEKKYLLVKGEFGMYYRSTRRVGSSPDGDSVWFRPYNPDLLKDFRNRSMKANSGGFAQLRFEAIDALELHYKGAEQNHELAVEARDFNVKELGFTAEYSPKLYLTVNNAAPDLTEGYILTRGMDWYGRPVSFVFLGKPDEHDGAEVFLDLDRLDQSMNAALVKSGNAYPGFYTSLPKYLRNHILRLARRAQADELGVWEYDRTMDGFGAGTLEDLEKLAIWPKLFRRLVKYFNVGEIGLDDFELWMSSDIDNDDDMWIVSEGAPVSFHEVIEVRRSKLRMLYPPDDLVIVPK